MPETAGVAPVNSAVQPVIVEEGRVERVSGIR
jgi:hypothetical protein